MTRQAGIVWFLLAWLVRSRLGSQLNCLSGVDEWSQVVEHNVSASALVVMPTATGPGVISCLNGQDGVTYRVSLLGDGESKMYTDPSIHVWEGSAPTLVSDPPVFRYLVYGGRYRLEFAVCQTKECDMFVYSEYINIQSEIKPWCQVDPGRTNSTLVEISDAVVNGATGLFQFSYSPCSAVQAYDTANVTLYHSEVQEDCGSTVLLVQTLPVEKDADGNASISFLSPEVEGDSYYCVSVSLSDISCRLSSQPPPSYCSLRSEPVWIHSRPLIAVVFPFCGTHLSCAWLYIVLVGSVILLVSVLLAVLCVRCCDRRTRTKLIVRHDDEVDFSGEVINLTSTLPDRRTWTELHTEWEAGIGEERPRGKILLLYSPDTKLFKELQEALKSFLDLACHCDIYDLFEDALFDSIALDPAVWLEEFVKDRDVKIIIISSIGASRRQMALQGQIPLNLPENSLLDGLFTSGLRFVSSYPGLNGSGRVATARYEMLHLTGEQHRLLPPVGGSSNREFLIPTQLHEIFCWIHHLQPLELMGKPWVNYHLELQLLQDALKLVRRDRTLLANSSEIVNGFANP